MKGVVILSLFNKNSKKASIQKDNQENQPAGIIVQLQNTFKMYFKYMTTLGAHVSHLWKLILIKTVKLIKKLGLFVAKHIVTAVKKISGAVKTAFSNLMNKPVSYFKNLKSYISKKKKEKGVIPAGFFLFKSIGKTTWSKRGLLVKSFSYVAPVVCITLLVSLLTYTSQTKYAIGVEYNGVVIGYVEDETVAEEAQRVVLDRINYVDGDQAIEVDAQLTVQKLSDDKSLYNSDQLANVIISASDADFVEAYGIYVNNKFVGAVDSISNIQAETQKLLDAVKTDNPTETVEFVDIIEYKQGLYLEKGIVSEQEIVDKFTGLKQVDAYYEVVSGDAPTSIADKLQIPYADLKSLNPDIESSLFVGDELLINKAKPYLSIRTTREESYDVTIPYQTEKVNDSSIWEGNTKTLKYGSNGSKHIEAKVSIVDGVEESRVITSSVVTKEPVKAKVAVGTKSTGAPADQIAASGGGFMWPVGNGYNYISSPFGWRSIGWHTGIDIASNGAHLPIFASQSGKVVESYYRGSYGNQILIDHGNGVQTRYAHLSSYKVSAGDYVEKGDLIGIMGTTGRSSGIHLHFEIISYGNFLNPANYVHK